MKDELNTKSWIKRHADLVGIIGVFTGILIGVGIPIWQNYWVESPKLGLEIDGISRSLSKNATLPLSDETIAVIFSSGSRSSSFSRRVYIRNSDGRMVRETIQEGKGLAPMVIYDAINDAKTELRELPKRIETRKKELAEVELLKPETVVLSSFQSLNFPLRSEVAYDFNEFTAKVSERASNLEYFKALIDKLLAKYRERVDEVETRYSQLQTQLPIVERNVDKLNTELESHKSQFTVSAVMSNSGRSTISIRQTALFRIYIGPENYVDLKLLLKDYANNAEIPAHGTKIVTFTSKEISALPKDDQALINTYWGQSVHCILFIEDTNGSIHNSNRIAFAEGLYQKIIYGRLADEASNKGHFKPVP